VEEEPVSSSRAKAPVPDLDHMSSVRESRDKARAAVAAFAKRLVGFVDGVEVREAALSGNEAVASRFVFHRERVVREYLMKGVARVPLGKKRKAACEEATVKFVSEFQMMVRVLESVLRQLDATAEALARTELLDAEFRSRLTSVISSWVVSEAIVKEGQGSVIPGPPQALIDRIHEQIAANCAQCDACWEALARAIGEGLGDGQDVLTESAKKLRAAFGLWANICSDSSPVQAMLRDVNVAGMLKNAVFDAVLTAVREVLVEKLATGFDAVVATELRESGADRLALILACAADGTTWAPNVKWRPWLNGGGFSSAMLEAIVYRARMNQRDLIEYLITTALGVTRVERDQRQRPP
jgi:hypothetical protein